MNPILSFLQGLLGNGSKTTSTPTSASSQNPPTSTLKPPSTDNSDTQKIHSTHLLDPNDLRTRLQAEVEKEQYQPRPDPDSPKLTETFCNRFTYEVASWYGFDFFKKNDMRANDIHQYLKSHPEQWKRVAGPDLDYTIAIEAANQGCLLIAAQSNSISGHGHVNIIAPEPDGERSDSWKKIVPFVANVGKSCWYGKRLSQSFIQEPNTYLYIGS